MHCQKEFGTSALIELEWVDDTLEIAQQWPMKDVSHAEGIAYGADNKGGALLSLKTEGLRFSNFQV